MSTPPSTKSEDPFTLEQAREVARAMIEDEFVLLDKATIEREFGWVFFYTTRRHAETGNIRYAKPGNAPIAVERDGRASFLTTAAHPQRVIEEYERRWRQRQS